MFRRLGKYDKVGLVIFGAFLITSGLYYCFEEQFDSDRWKQNVRSRHYMADNLINDNTLIGKSPQEIIELLGNPIFTESEGEDVFVYGLGTPPSFRNRSRQYLLIVFVENKAEWVAISKKPLE